MNAPYPNHLRQLRGGRYTQEELAEKVGVDPSTYRSWEDGLHRPRPTSVRALCRVLGVRAEELGFGDAAELPPEEPTGPESLKVAIAVVTDGPHVLLVCRRDDSGGSAWQFPAGVVKPGMKPAVIAVRETYTETGVHCTVRERLGTRLHPITRVFCEYFLCDYLGGTIENKDVIENVSTEWVERAKLTNFIRADSIFPPIVEALEIDKPR